MTKIYIETDTSYIPEEDITIIWQNMYKYVEGEGDTHIQRALVGWYHGKPNDKHTAYYSTNVIPMIANYVDCEN